MDRPLNNHDMRSVGGFGGRSSRSQRLPEIRRASFRHSLVSGQLLRVLEAHSGLAAVIAETVTSERNQGRVGFDAVWLSSFTNASTKARLDNEGVDIGARMQIINDVLDAVALPLIYDADSGGLPEHLRSSVRTLERLGVSAVAIEDRVGLKRNSLHPHWSQHQAKTPIFCEKIQAAVEARISNDFLVIARIESLITGAGIENGLLRAEQYVKAGADGILIHSKSRTPDEILEFCRLFRATNVRTSLCVIPTTYPHATEDMLAEAGVNVVIYANHLLRSAYRAMVSVAEIILANGRALEAEEYCFPIVELLNLLEEREG